MAPCGINCVKRSANAAVLTFLYVRCGRGVGELVRGNQGIHAFGRVGFGRVGFRIEVRRGRGVGECVVELPGLLAVIMI